MNKARRKELQRAEKLIEEAKEIIDSCRDEEEEYKENMPENMQYGEKWDKAEESIDAMDNALASLDEVIDYIGEAVE